jgi:hypothetical protein
MAGVASALTLDDKLKRARRGFAMAGKQKNFAR